MLQWIPQVFLILTAMLLAWLAWRSKSQPLEERLPALTLAALFPLIATPHALLHDLLVLVPVLALMAWYAESRFLAATAVTLYLGSLALPSLAYFLRVAVLAIFPILLFLGFLHQVFIRKGTPKTEQGADR